MSENFQTALTVLAVGMTTVILILSLVVLSGKLLINVVNRYVPVNEVPKSKRSKSGFLKNKTNPAVIAAITAAVNATTSGTGKITSIEKVDN